MILLALLLAVSNATVTVPPAHWTSMAVPVDRNGSTIYVTFDVADGDPAIQAMILTRVDAERFNRGRSNKPLLMSGFRHSDRFRLLVPDAGDYVLMLDNRLNAGQPARVALQLEVSHPGEVGVTTVPEARKRATEALSVLFLGAVVVFSAVKFLRN